MDYETMFEKVKALLGDETKGMISTRTVVEIQDNGDVHFRQNTGIIDGILFWRKDYTSISINTDIDTPLKSLKTLADVRAFLGMKKLFDIITDEDVSVENVCVNCRELEENLAQNGKALSKMEIMLKEKEIDTQKLKVYEDIFANRSTIRITDK